MAVVQNYLPGDSLLIDKIVCELKSQGIFDEFRKECIADVDTKPAYQNLRQRVEGSVSGFLNKQTWNPDMNKNHVRELLRKNIYESGFLEIGVERIVDQVVNPKINSVFLPKVTEVVYKFLGIERPNCDKSKPEDTKVKSNANNLLPTDLEAVSPESETLEKKHDKSNDSQNLDDSKIDEDESPPFEPIEEQTTYLPNEENSVDSHLSGFSGLLSHDSNQSQDINKPMQVETSNQDSIISKHSSDGHLSIVMSDDTDMKMEFCEDSHQSKSSKTNDSNSKTFDFENSSRSSSSKTEKRSDHKSEDKSRTDKSKSYDKHKSGKSKDRKEDRDRKSDHDKRDYKEKHSSKSRDKSKDGKDYKSSRKVDKDRDLKSDKDRDSKTDKNEKSKSCNGSHHRSSSSSSSKDKSSSRKESTSKDSSSKDKSKTSSSRAHKDSKSREDKDKSHTKHDSKTDKSKKDDKHDRHHSRSEKHSSSSSKNKDKDKKEAKKEKKENKDDHFSSKKHSDRRSTDRDSNDGQSGLKSSSSSFDSYFSSQTQSKNQESSNSNSNTGSGESGASDAVESETVNLKTPITFVNDDIENVGEVYINTEVQESLPRIKLIKPKFASNIHEARKLMKIRKQLSKIEQQNALQFSKALNNQETLLVKAEVIKEKGNNYSKTDHKPNILKKEEKTKKHNVILESPLHIEVPNQNSVTEEEISQVSPPLKSSVVSAASWDALEAKFNQNIDYSTYYDDPDTPEKTNESIININRNRDDCFYFNEDDIQPITERYILFIMTLIEKLEREIASSRQEETINPNDTQHISPEADVQKIDRENGLKKSFSRKTFKRKLMEYSDAKNNNKKFNNHHIEVHENFSLPLSPAESDISVDKKSDVYESEKPLKKSEVEVSVKFKKNNITSAKRQRYSSEDLYKPRPLFSGSRRRARNNLELD